MRWKERNEKMRRAKAVSTLLIREPDKRKRDEPSLGLCLLRYCPHLTFFGNTHCVTRNFPTIDEFLQLSRFS